MEELSCGCKFASDEEIETFIFEPCSLTCKYYRFVAQEFARQKKEVVHLHVDESTMPKKEQ